MTLNFSLSLPHLDYRCGLPFQVCAVLGLEPDFRHARHALYQIGYTPNRSLLGETAPRDWKDLLEATMKFRP